MSKQITIAVGLILNAEGEILLARRNQPENPIIHNKLEFPGGGIEIGEQPEAALLREIKEETGLETKIVRLLPKVYDNLWDWPSGQVHVIILSYVCKPVRGVLQTSDPEVGELKYFKLDEINYSDCLPKTKEIIDLIKM